MHLSGVLVPMYSTSVFFLVKKYKNYSYQNVFGFNMKKRAVTAKVIVQLWFQLSKIYFRSPKTANSHADIPRKVLTQYIVHSFQRVGLK